ncbi:MAG: amino acid adenylation domain-containing protein, partial [Gammaproteobacteria bacterium]|nr:amino acid adenylation domain-containing protein [Gammaproteobacteria bacterium]
MAELRSAGVEIWADGDRLRYRAPRGALDRDRRDQLLALKPELLSLLRDAGPAPLTWQQQSFWLLEQLNPGSTAANEQFVIRLSGLSGELDIDRLQSAWHQLLTRHDALHCRIQHSAADIGQIPEQYLQRHPILVEPGRQDAEALLRLASQDINDPFDLHRGPLLRARLLDCDTGDHVLLVTAHHICADGLSVPLIRDELARLYGGETLSAAPSYQDYARRQRAADDDARALDNLRYWREQLEDLPPAVALPRRAQTTARRLQHRVRVELPVDVADDLRRLARQQQVTSFILLLAALRALIARLSGQHDVPIGSPVTARDSALTAGMVGCLVNNLVYRSSTAGNPGFDELLRRERATALAAYDHRELPFERIVAELNPARRAGEHPLFQVLMLYDAAVSAAPVGGDVEFALEAWLPERQSFWDLEWNFHDSGSGGPLAITLGYCRELFDDWFADTLPARLAVLLRHVLRDPQARLSDLDVLLWGEQQKILFGWNAGEVREAANLTLDRLFARQATATPDAIAIEYRNRQVSYRELQQQAAQLAAVLQRRGVAPGHRVGLALPRSPELVAAILAVLSRGAICVPLDPGYPAERLRRYAEMAEPKVIFGWGANRRSLYTDHDVIWLHEFDWVGETGSVDESLARPDDPAWLLFTSGSTGEPKGALGSHRQAVQRCCWMCDGFDFRADDVFAQRSSLNFIDAFWEIFGALKSGASIAIIPDEDVRDAARFLQQLARCAVSHVVLVPALLKALLDTAADIRAALPELRLVISSGEALPPELVQRFQRAAPGIRLLNTYGTSEVWDASVADLTAAKVTSRRIPIGRPIPGRPAYVLSDALQIQPPGVVGELFIGGVDSAAGYWRDPVRTASHFLRDPHRPGERIYRTGDLARWLPDGALDLLGRRDRQVKLQGLRIEPGDVESALVQHAGIDAAAVAVRSDGRSQKRLFAWVVPVAAGVAETRALRRYLLEQLPVQALPTVITVVDQLPLLPNGKLDYEALPDPPASAASRPGKLSGVERVIASSWRQLLDTGPLDRTADFFALGGQSLLATRMLADLNGRLDVELSPRDLFLDPTIEALAAVIERRQRQTAIDSQLPAPRPREPLPLSWGQERLWFLEQLDPGSPAYHIAFTIDLEGDLDRMTLAAAVQDLADRHDSLRTVFPASRGRPSRRVLDHVDPPITLCKSDAEFAAMASQPFDLVAGPLIRFGIATAGLRQHRLLIVVHHLVSDGQSSGVLLRDLAELYAARRECRAAKLPVLTTGYCDFVTWQRRALSAAALARQVHFWREQLAGAPALLELPSDRPRPAEQGFHGAWVRRNWPAERLRSLRRFARHRHCSLFMLLLAAFHLLLQRYSGQTDICVGTPVAGRPRADFDDLVGLFINTLVIRLRLDPASDTDELLAMTRAAVLAAQAHQDVPFEQLVDALQPERSLSHAPLFQVMFNLTAVPDTRLSAGDVTWRLGGLLEHGVSNFDLSLNIGEHADGAALIFEYDRDLFDAVSIELIADCYERLLDEMLARPQQMIGTLALLDAESRARLLLDNVATRPFETPVHEQVGRWANATPNACAVVADAGSLTYAELDADAERLATALVSREIGRGDVVAVCGDAEPALLTAILAILKTGAAFLPLDSRAPAARLGQMLELANPALLLTTSPTPVAVSGFSALDTRELLALSQPAARCAQQPVLPDDPAYLLFTSGSTGAPKAVSVSHASLAAAADAWRAAYDLLPQDRHLQMANPGFDVFTGDWVRALTSGATLVMCPRERLLDPASLYAYLCEQAVTCAEFVPAVVRLLIGYLRDSGGDLAHLRLLIVGSDYWTGREYNALRDLVGSNTRIINSYGVAEATIDSSWFESGQHLAEDKPVPIGRAFPHACLYVCDDKLQLLPPGIPGELCIGGPGVAQGYVNSPALTAARFVADPFSAESGARLYRTGDRARWRADGELELLGRLDGQLKLRGFRIEPGEIETVLSSHPGVAAAVVGLHGDGPAARLVAWVVPRGALDLADLRGHAVAVLPDYMVPAGWSVLDRLPLTPNGKLDRRALPAPTWSTQRALSRQAPVAPGTAVEAALCELFAAVLGTAVVGVQDDFFALGGHSLLATQLVSRIRDTLEVELPLRAVFETPTPAGIARCLDSASLDDRAARLVATDRRGNTAPASFMQQRLWFVDRLQPGSPVYNLVWALRLRGDFDLPAFETALQALLRRHESLRTVFAEKDGEPVQRLLAECNLDLHRQTLDSITQANRLEAFVEQPFDLAAGPLLRVGLFDIAPDEQFLVLVVHHIIADGWSLGVLFSELAAFYNAARRGIPAGLPPLPLQYADYAQWQQGARHQHDLMRQLDYWREQLVGAPERLMLPLDFSRPAQQAHRGAWIQQRLPADWRQAAEALAAEQGVTLFMLLLAAFGGVLGRWSGSADVVVGTPIAGRNRSELEGLIGFFVNTLVLRTDLSGNPRFTELLARVKRTALDAYAHPDLPFERLVDELQLPRNTGRTPVFQVLFNLHNEPARTISFDGLFCEPVAVRRHTAKFDLSVSVTESEAGLHVQVEYDTDLFQEATVAAILSSYEGVLRRVTASPQCRLSDWLAGEEGEGVAIASPRRFAVPDVGGVFAQVAAAVPKRLAVASGAYRWSYGALAEYARRVAVAVVSAGGAVGDRIGLVAAHDAPLVAGLLGIVQAGRAYVPLDPGYPPARLEARLADAGITAVVTDTASRTVAAPLAATAGVPLLEIDVGVREPATVAPIVAIPADSPAYVLYTSGSTGAPKGVVQSHAGLLSQLGRYSGALGLDADDRLSWLSGYGFDAAVQDIFGALLSGASLHPVDLGSGLAASDAVGRLADAGVTVVHATPTVYRHLFGGELTCRHDLGAIRQVVLGGEVARRSDFELFCSRFADGARFINGYGLTECTVACQWVADKTTPVRGETLPLGTPVGDLAVVLLDDSGQPGWRGEIVLRGAGLAGSWLTEGPHPSDQAPREYRTGDLGWRRADGELMYLGRGDGQVQLRGMRLELDEVAVVLAAHGGITAAAAALKPGPGGESQLVGYYVATAELAADGLVAHCRDRLPGWAVPAVWQRLDALPRLANGKLDRAALPVPARAGNGSLPPRTELEQALAALWIELLGVDQVHLHDDFFALGGHSLLATRLIA